MKKLLLFCICFLEAFSVQAAPEYGTANAVVIPF